MGARKKELNRGTKDGARMLSATRFEDRYRPRPNPPRRLVGQYQGYKEYDLHDAHRRSRNSDKS